MPINTQADLELAANSETAAQDLGTDPSGIALQVSGLTVSYGTKPAVFSVDATVPTASMTAIIGPNGAGKSTFLKAVLGIVPRISGTALIAGHPLESMRRAIAYVPQRASVDWDFPTRVRDVVTMGQFRQLGLLGLVHRSHRQKTMDCLQRVGMADFADRQIGQLSGGQQQRVFLARALAQNADLYLLDEPFAGVDAATEKAIIDVLKDLRQDGRTVVCVHHDLATVADYFDRVLMLNIRKIAEGPVATTFTGPVLQDTYGGRLATAHIDQLKLD